VVCWSVCVRVCVCVRVVACLLVLCDCLGAACSTKDGAVPASAPLAPYLVHLRTRGGRGQRDVAGATGSVMVLSHDTNAKVILDLLSPLDARSNICRVCVCVCVPACLLVRARACARLGRPTRMKPWCGATLHACRRYNAFSDSACQETASVGLKADPPPHLTHPSTTHRSCLQMK
jgi:hypothetical protein